MFNEIIEQLRQYEEGVETRVNKAREVGRKEGKQEAMSAIESIMSAEEPAPAPGPSNDSFPAEAPAPDPQFPA